LVSESRVSNDDVEITPPCGGGSSDKNSSTHDTLRGLHVDELTSELKQLKLQRKIDKPKKKLKLKKSQQVTSSSSSNEESDASFEEEIKGKSGRNEDKKSYSTTSFNYDNLPSFSTFTSIPIGKAPRFHRTDYTKWKYMIKMYLISLNLSVWIVVCICVDFLEEDE
jgi:hypothetical protein